MGAAVALMVYVPHGVLQSWFFLKPCCSVSQHAQEHTGDAPAGPCVVRPRLASARRVGRGDLAQTVLSAAVRAWPEWVEPTSSVRMVQGSSSVGCLSSVIEQELERQRSLPQFKSGPRHCLVALKPFRRCRRRRTQSSARRGLRLPYRAARRSGQRAATRAVSVRFITLFRATPRVDNTT